MSQFSVLQSSLAKGCDKLGTTWSVELPYPLAILLGHCPSRSLWKPTTKFALLIATDRSLLLEYCLQKLAGLVFVNAHNCWPCSFLYVRFLRRSSCLSYFFHSRARWLSGWSFAYANTSLCLLRHSVSNHGWWRCCVVLVCVAGQPCTTVATLQMQSCNNCMAMSTLSMSLIRVVHWAICCCRCWQYCVHLLTSCLKQRMSARDSEVADDTCYQGNCKLSESGVWSESHPFPQEKRAFMYNKWCGIIKQSRWCDHIIHMAGAAIGKASALPWFITCDPAIENEQSRGATKV